MLVSAWHVGSPTSRAQCTPGRVSRVCLTAGRTFHSQSSAIWASGVFVVGYFVPKPRISCVGRLPKKISVVEDTSATEAKPESMLDRLHDRAAALGGKCLAIGYRNNRTKVPWQCQHGHTWDAVPHSVLNRKTVPRVCQKQAPDPAAAAAKSREFAWWPVFVREQIQQLQNQGPLAVQAGAHLGGRSIQRSLSWHLVPRVLPERANS